MAKILTLADWPKSLLDPSPPLTMAAPLLADKSLSHRSYLTEFKVIAVGVHSQPAPPALPSWLSQKSSPASTTQVCNSNSSSLRIMSEVTTTENRTISAMSVNIKLCGSIPRRELIQPRGALWEDVLTSSASVIGGCGDSTLPKTAVCDGLNSAIDSAMAVLGDRPALAPIFEPPSWAVPARGEARLEVGFRWLVCLVHRDGSVSHLFATAGMRNGWPTSPC